MATKRMYSGSLQDVARSIERVKGVRMLELQGYKVTAEVS